MSGPLDPEAVVGALAEPSRLRTVAVLVLGATTLSEVTAGTGLSLPEAQRALDRLARIGLVERAGGSDGAPVTFRFRADVLAELARARPRHNPAPPDATTEQARTLRHFVVDGRLSSVPVGRAKRLVVLDWLAGRFEPGRVYPEREVNFLLGLVHADYAALRRYLVDEGFLERRDGFYWRAGGTFPVE